MKRTIITFAAVLAVGFALGTMVPRTPPTSTAVGIAAPLPAGLASPVPDRCPNIHHAMEALQTSLHDMEKANHDYCGHKEEAMDATSHALEQLRKAEDCDRCRD